MQPGQFNPYQYHDNPYGQLQPGMMGAGNPYGGMVGSNPMASYGGGNPYANPYGNPYGNPNAAIAGGMGSSNGSGQNNSQSGSVTGNIIADLMRAFGGSRSDFTNPSNAAMPYLNQIPGVAGKYFDPYINAGLGAMGQLQGQYGGLINDPGGKLNQIGKSFQQSPGYQFQVDQSLGAANRAGAASGMAGSPMEQQNLAGTVNNLANQDYYNWLNQATGMYKEGLGGLQGLNQMGFQASGDMATDLMNALMSQAQFAYQGQNTQNMHDAGQNGSMWANLADAARRFF